MNIVIRARVAVSWLLSSTLLLFGCPAFTAELTVQGGVLTGATGVVIDGTSYTVRFHDGTCKGIFGGCDSIPDFALQSPDAAWKAGFALLNQVFIDSSKGKFDSKPSLTFGCLELNKCLTVIPFAYIQSSVNFPPTNSIQSQVTVVNVGSGVPAPDGTTLPYAVDQSLDTSDVAHQNYAVFSKDAASKPNPVVLPDAKWWAETYLDLFQRTYDDLKWLGIVAGLADGKAVQEVVLNALAWEVAEAIADLSSAPGDDFIVDVGGYLYKLDKVLDTTHPLSWTVAAAKAIVKPAIWALTAMVDDPPRDDYASVKTVSPNLELDGFDTVFSGGRFAGAYLDLAECSGDLTDGMQVMVLSAERAWGANIAGDSAALAAQGLAYSGGATKANSAFSRCAQAVAGFHDELGQLGTFDVDLLAQATDYGMLTDSDIDVLRNALLSTGAYSVNKIDSAIAYVLAKDRLPVSPGSIDDFAILGQDFARAGALPTALQVPEPATLTLLGLGLAGLGFSRRKQ